MRTERAVQLHSSAMAVTAAKELSTGLCTNYRSAPAHRPHRMSALPTVAHMVAPPACMPLAHCHQMDLIHDAFKWSWSKRRRHMMDRGSTDEAGEQKAFAHDAHHAPDADGTFCHCEAQRAARPDDIRDRRLTDP